MTSGISIGQRTAKTKENPLGWKIVDEIPFSETCVVYFGGDGADTDQAANGYAKVIEGEILPALDLQIPVYSIRYNFDTLNKNLSRKILAVKHRAERDSAKRKEYLEEAGEEERNPHYIDELYQKIIAPRLTETDGKTPLSAEKAACNLRKITFIAHCHGAYTALKLEQKMQKEMLNLGYTAEESRLVQSQMLVIAHTPACPLGISRSQFVSFMSAIDDSPANTPNNNFWGYIRHRNREERIRWNKEDIAQKKGEKPIIAERWFKLQPCYFPPKQGNLFLIKRKYEYIDPELTYCQINPAEHNNISYRDMSQTKDGRLLMYFSRNVILNGIRNALQQKEGFTPLPPLEELIQSPENIDTQNKEKAVFQQMYRNGLDFRRDVYYYTRDLHRHEQSKGKNTQKTR